MTRRTVARAVILVGVGGLAWLFVRQLDGAHLRAAFARARWRPLAAGLALPFAAMWCKALCWRVIFATNRSIAVRRLFRYTIAAFAGSALAPARAGEALRVWLLERDANVPVAQSAAVAVTEKLLDGVAMFVVMMPIALMPGLPAWVRISVVIAGGASVLAIAIFALLARVPRRAGSRIASFFAAMGVLRHPLALAGALGALIAAWLIDLALVELVLAAFAIAIPLAGVLVVMIAINLAILVPATPGQVGVHEAGALAGLAISGVPPEAALGFAVTYHAIQIIPVVFVGLLLEWRLVLGGAPERAP